MWYSCCTAGIGLAGGGGGGGGNHVGQMRSTEETKQPVEWTEEEEPCRTKWAWVTFDEMTRAGTKPYVWANDCFPYRVPLNRSALQLFHLIYYPGTFFLLGHHSCPWEIWRLFGARELWHFLSKIEGQYLQTQKSIRTSYNCKKKMQFNFSLRFEISDDSIHLPQLKQKSKIPVRV